MRPDDVRPRAGAAVAGAGRLRRRLRPLRVAPGMALAPGLVPLMLLAVPAARRARIGRRGGRASFALTGERGYLPDHLVGFVVGRRFFAAADIGFVVWRAGAGGIGNPP